MLDASAYEGLEGGGFGVSEVTGVAQEEGSCRAHRVRLRVVDVPGESGLDAGRLGAHLVELAVDAVDEFVGVPDPCGERAADVTGQHASEQLLLFVVELCRCAVEVCSQRACEVADPATLSSDECGQICPAVVVGGSLDVGSDETLPGDVELLFDPGAGSFARRCAGVADAQLGGDVTCGGEHGRDTVEGLRCLDAGVDADASAQGGHDALMCRCAVDVGSRAFRLGLLDLLFELADPSLQSR